MEIRDIAIDDVNIPDIRVYQPPGWTTNPSAIFAAPPITQEIGVPIVNIPGCVEAHEQNTTRERSGIIGEDDPKGVKTFCDAGVPSFGPIDYNPDELEYNYEPPVPKVVPPEPKTDIKKPKPTENPPPKCPTREQELKNPIGKILEGNKKITGYEQIGKECLMVTETLDVRDQIVLNIPNAGKVTATASIAVVATTSALLAKPLADLLMRVVKPTTKKIVKKIAAIRGKTVKVESVRDRRDEQRQRSAAIRALRLMKKK
jgi:hypothetical protein|tara:strand:- start:124 stop:900 length:777 start_codon:yes stop_codon:yes gene_type:complete